MQLKRWQKILVLSSYAAVIAALSLTPAKEMPTVDLWDKLQHFFAYFVFMVLAYPVADRLSHKLMLAIAVMAYSALMEFGQSLSPGRSPSGHDLVANSLGVIAALLALELIAALWRRYRRKR
ncbi:VanZ family protein [Spongiibacter tropicus]|uniref:VanZ family protein n=1 Tax=Spongiibacter tropicus TaxID=454602 RepID=UPI0003B79016|nr:VanZ family protein [Spongiibacter tropicus]